MGPPPPPPPVLPLEIQMFHPAAVRSQCCVMDCSQVRGETTKTQTPSVSPYTKTCQFDDLSFYVCDLFMVVRIVKASWNW